MGSFSDYLELKLLDYLFGKAAFAQPTIYVGLSTADPLDDASGLAEPGAGAYARVQTAAADWHAAAAGLIDNHNPIEFPECTVAWGHITHFALFDALNAGNMLAHGELTVHKDVDVGDTLRFAAGDLDVTLA